MRSCMAPQRVATFPIVHTLVIGSGPLYGSSCLFFFCRAPVLSPKLYMYAVFGFNFLVGYYCLLVVAYVDYQSVTNGVSNIMSHLDTIWPGATYNILWYVIHTAKLVAAVIPDQGSRYYFLKLKIRTHLLWLYGFVPILNLPANFPLLHTLV